MAELMKRTAAGRCWQLPVFLYLALLTALISSQFSKPPQPPIFIKRLEKHMKLEFGPLNRFVLECSANGEPTPKFTWFKNGKQLVEDSVGITLISNTDHSLLDFSQPAPDHEGFYHCTAENDYGKAKSTIVHVTPNPEQSAKGQAPKFIKSPEIEVLRAGNTARFNCEATGKPQPTVVWSKNGEVIPGESGSQLVIHDIGSEDVANYACNVSNIAGYEYSDTYLTILTVPASITRYNQTMFRYF